MAEFAVENGKKWWKSKTLWVNLLLLAVKILQMYLNAKLPPVVNNPDNQVVLAAGANILLRLLTKQPLALK